MDNLESLMSSMQITTFLDERQKENAYKLPKNYLSDCSFTPLARHEVIVWFVRRTGLGIDPHVNQLALHIFDRFVYAERECQCPDLVMCVAFLIAIVADGGDPNNGSSDCVRQEILTRYPNEAIDSLYATIFGTFFNNPCVPMPWMFLERLNTMSGHDAEGKFLGTFLIEVAQISYSMCHIRPSLLASTAYCLSAAMLTNDFEFNSIWSQKFVEATGYIILDINPVLSEFTEELKKILTNPQSSVVYEKYSVMLEEQKAILDRTIGWDSVYEIIFHFFPFKH